MKTEVGYILEGQIPVPCYDIIEWSKWFEKAERHVKLDVLPGDVKVSTVFLGLDHGYMTGKKLLFETMVFGGEHDQYCRRYSTWKQAESGHKQTIKMCSK